MNPTDKITAGHLRRKAYLYIRQSTAFQVEQNPESTRRQYRFQDQAVALGWHPTPKPTSAHATALRLDNKAFCS